MPWARPSSCNTTLQAAVITGGAIPRKGAGGGHPGGLPDALPAGPPRPLGAAGVVSVQEDPPGSGGCEPGQRGAGPQAHGAGLIGWHHLPTPSAPTVHPRTQAVQASGTWRQPRSPRPEGNSQHSFSVFSVLYWCRCDLQCCRVCLLFCSRCTAAWFTHVYRVHVLFWVLFSYSL